jgi:hypothetical protein
MTRRLVFLLRLLRLGLVLALVVAPVLAGQARPASTSTEKAVQELTIDDMRSVLGTPRDDASGVSDFSLEDKGEVFIAYRYYDVDEDNYETDFATEIAPKIQSLFKKFRSLDRVRFEIMTNRPTDSPLWKPLSQFALDRKTLEKLHWTWFVSRDILDQVLRNEKH